MFGAHQAELQMAHWQRTLPAEVAIEGRERPVTRTALVAVIRAELLPFITYGPTYERAVADELHRALDMYSRGRGQEFAYWLNEALRAGIKARRVEPFSTDFVHVTATAWGISYATGTDIEGARLNVHGCDETAPNDMGGIGVVYRHPVYDGLTFHSVDEASEFAYNAGLLKRHARRWATTRA
ncbi:hypothetical protein [Streptomyces sp. NPDC056683]|uniref:hypothetical protein n=1 Tax=Streptomyces sp. NPDC056683 TaxID=3345910 RepID=UPI0036A11481